METYEDLFEYLDRMERYERLEEDVDTTICPYSDDQTHSNNYTLECNLRYVMEKM